MRWPLESGRRSAIAVVLAVAGALLSPAAFADQAQPDCRLKRTLQLPLTYNDGNVPLIPASINGHDVFMLLDTGAVLSGIGQPTIDNLKLETKQSKQTYYLAAAIPLNQQVTVDSFALGRMRSGKALFVAFPKELVPSGAAGNMGADFMQSFDVELDFGGNQVAFFLPDRCPTTNVVYWTSQPYARIPFEFNANFDIEVPVTVDGMGIDAILDTGSTFSWTSARVAEVRLNVKPGDPADVDLAESKDGKEKLVRHRFKTLTFGGITVTNPEIHIEPEVATTWVHRPIGGYTLVIGMSVLRQLHIYIAYKERALYITPADAR